MVQRLLTKDAIILVDLRKVYVMVSNKRWEWEIRVRKN